MPQRMSISTWRKQAFYGHGDKLAPGALSLTSIRKMIDGDEIPGERIGGIHQADGSIAGGKYFVLVDDEGQLINSDPLISRVMAG